MIAKEAGRQWPDRINGVISIEGWTHWRVTREAFHKNIHGTLTPEQNEQRLMGRQRATGHWTHEQRHELGKIWRKWERGEEFLLSTELPVLEIYGDRGTERPSRELLRIPDRENITLRWIENASHSLPLEAPVEITNIITKYIQSIEGTTSSKLK